jgi:hypothetical protein
MRIKKDMIGKLVLVNGHRETVDGYYQITKVVLEICVPKNYGRKKKVNVYAKRLLIDGSLGNEELFKYDIWVEGVLSPDDIIERADRRVDGAKDRLCREETNRAKVKEFADTWRAAYESATRKDEV